MQKKSPNSGLVSARTLVVLFACAAVCLIATRSSPAFLRSEAPANLSQRTFTFAERVAYQRAIEDVYWRHRIWPRERPDPKPSLDAVMSQAQLEKKVADYLRKSQALEDYWQRPITADQLQAEMDRMAKHTKQPEVLRELFNALGNDPFVIAECLARPALAERLVTSWYPYDERIHGELKERAEAELKTHDTVEQIRQTSGTYSEIEFIKSDNGETVGQAHRLPDGQLAGGAPALQPQDSTRAVKLNSGEWDQAVQKLSATFNKSSASKATVFARNGGLQSAAQRFATAAGACESLPIGTLSPLQEDEGHFYAAIVIDKTNGHFKLATVSWLKESLESWLARVENQGPAAMTTPSSNYTLPQISDGGCIDDTWTAISGQPDARHSHTAVWTGNEMIIWGGEVFNFIFFSTGGRYNPGTDSWMPTSGVNAPTARSAHTAVWTGTEMIVWGGYDGTTDLDTGGRYDPNTDSWTPTSTADAPPGRRAHTAVWTGSEMIVWGGYPDVNTGGRYDPKSDSWTATAALGAPSGRSQHSAVWTGSEMIVWGGITFAPNYLNTGGRYNPNTDTWTATSLANAPTPRADHTAVWTGVEMIIWGGFDGLFVTNQGGRYNPNTDTWTATNLPNAPTPRTGHTAVWTSVEMIIWGGYDGNNDPNTGGRYNPNTDIWTAITTANAPSGRSQHSAVWTGSEMIVWGGQDIPSEFNTGGRYDPSEDSWTSTRGARWPSRSYRGVDGQ